MRRAEDDRAATHDGGAVGTLTRVTGTLLLEGLLAAAGHEGTGLDGVSAGTESIAVSTNHEVQNLRPNFDFKHFRSEGDFTGFLHVLIVNFHKSHCFFSWGTTACAQARGRS